MTKLVHVFQFWDVVMLPETGSERKSVVMTLVSYLRFDFALSQSFLRPERRVERKLRSLQSTLA